MLGHRTRLNKFKKIETIGIMFSNSNSIKLAINDGMISELSSNLWKLNRHFSTTHESREKFREKLENILN